MSELPFFLKESRHIFSICPECGNVHRLSDLQLSTKGRYTADWLDALSKKQILLENRQTILENRRLELQRDAKKRAERTELPKLLSRVAPAFNRWKIDPRDVRTLSDPIEFVAFEGLNSEDGVQRISLLHLGNPHKLTKSIEHAISAGNFRWNTLRLDDDGTITQRPSNKKVPEFKIEPFHLRP